MTLESLDRRPSPQDHRDALRAIVPEAFRDGELDLALLAELLGSTVDDAAEHYGLTWPGQRQARQQAARSAVGTLRPTPRNVHPESPSPDSLIVGNNLEVLRILQASYRGRVKLIYIDPPYNTGQDFIYNDNFADPVEAYLEATQQRDFSGLLTSNPKSSGRFHSRWLSSMYARLTLARSLLRDDGFIVVSIDDAELPQLSLLMESLFGRENYIATLVWDKNRKNDARYVSVGHEYMLVYALNRAYLDQNDVVLRAPKEGIDEARELFERLRREHRDDWAKVTAEWRRFYAALADDDPRKPLGRFSKVDVLGPFRDDGDLSWPGGGGPRYEVIHPTTERPCKIPSRGWIFPTPARFWEEFEAGRVVFGSTESTVPARRRSLFEQETQVLRSVTFSYAQTSAQTFDEIFGGLRVFDHPKPISDIARIVEYFTGPDDLVVDFFAGSGTTGHAVWEVNQRAKSSRRFVLVQLPEPITSGSTTAANALSLGLQTIDAVTVERLKRVAPRYEGVGLQVFELARSSVVRWRAYEGTKAGELGDLFASRSGLVSGWKAEDVVVELMLENGYPLDASRIQGSEFVHNTVWRVTHAFVPVPLLVCLDETLADETIEALPDQSTFVCLETALTDSQKISLADAVTRVRTI